MRSIFVPVCSLIGNYTAREYSPALKSQCAARDSRRPFFVSRGMIINVLTAAMQSAARSLPPFTREEEAALESSCGV
jgi:hypothetical protein